MKTRPPRQRRDDPGNGGPATSARGRRPETLLLAAARQSSRHAQGANRREIGAATLIRARAAARLGDSIAARAAIAEADQARDRATAAAELIPALSQLGASPADYHSCTGAALAQIPGADQESGGRVGARDRAVHGGS